ncbi:MAG: MaoC/PaaZ C-terminal domain-containing protein [Sphingobium sp.]
MPLSPSIPEISLGPISRTDLALYAGASGDHNPVHIDLDFAKEAGLDDVFVHGMLSFGVLARVVTEWAGQERLRDLSIRFAAITQVHDKITCSGQISGRFEENGHPMLRVALQAVTQDGRTTLTGEATVDASEEENAFMGERS